MIEEVRKEVCLLIGGDKSGHGMDHISRVERLSQKFALKEGANQEVVSLIALLHDVDDYKLFGSESAKNLTNAKMILEKFNFSDDIKSHVLSEISCIGYSKYLTGVRPKTIEGMVVSDADMCDGIGATGILRSYKYNINHGNLFFDKNIFPIEDLNTSDYMNKKNGTVITHMFEKLLKLNNLMMTNSGKGEAKSRHDFMINFLYQFFYEEDANEWKEYLDDYIKKM